MKNSPRKNGGRSMVMPYGGQDEGPHGTSTGVGGTDGVGTMSGRTDGDEVLMSSSEPPAANENGGGVSYPSSSLSGQEAIIGNLTIE